MKRKAIFFSLLLLAGAASLAGEGAQQASTAKGQQNEMEKRGNEAMGFEQARAVHHFRLLRDGGTIQVQARDARDAETIAHVRAHLRQIAAGFARGDFSPATHAHGRVPPGVPTMRRLKDQIRYAYSPVARGGRVRISSRNAEAVGAIHEFLRFQIQAHGTGDSTAVQ
jgi:hypothetical protein